MVLNVVLTHQLEGFQARLLQKLGEWFREEQFFSFFKQNVSFCTVSSIFPLFQANLLLKLGEWFLEEQISTIWCKIEMK